jgi:hypothetical protein
VAFKDVTNKTKMIRSALILFLTFFGIQFWQAMNIVGIGKGKEKDLSRI